MKDRLTMEMLENAEPNSILFCGVVEDSPKGFNMMNTGKLLKYVLVRRGIKDWCIYCDYLKNNASNQHIFNRGQKVPKEYVENVISCSGEVMDWCNI